MELQREENRIFGLNESGDTVAEVTFPFVREGVVAIDRTFVDDSLRGQGVAGKLVDAAYDAIKADGNKAVPTCSYAVKWFEQRPEKNDIVVSE